EVRPIFFLALHHFGVEQSGTPQIVTQLGEQVGVLCVSFGENVAGTVQRSLGIVNIGVGVEIAFCERSGFATRLRQNSVSQRLQPCLAGNLGTGAALGLVWRVQVFQTLLGVGSVNLRPQLGRQLALGVNGLKYG